ncbi:MAG: hypothetical protein EOM52_01090 [Clostridia bacterium]|nr:hypothetical protein [Clostridia bacterium]
MNAYQWKQVLKADGEAVLSLSLRRPDLSGGNRALRRIGRYYEKLGDAWKTRWETTLFQEASAALRKAREESRPFQPWTAALDFVVTREDNGILSLYLDASERGAAACPSIVRSADTWDLKTGAPCALTAFLPPALHKRKELITELKHQAAAQFASGESLFFQDVEERVGAAFSPSRFYLGESGPVLFYPMLSLGSAAERIPAFPIS